MGYDFLLQRILPTQGLNLNLLLWEADSLPLGHLGAINMILNYEEIKCLEQVTQDILGSLGSISGQTRKGTRENRTMLKEILS